MDTLDTLHRFLRKPGILKDLDCEGAVIERDKDLLRIVSYPNGNPIFEVRARQTPFRTIDYNVTYYSFIMTTMTKEGEEIPGSIISDLLCALSQESEFSFRLAATENDGQAAVIFGTCLDTVPRYLEESETFLDIYWLLKDYSGSLLQESILTFFTEAQADYEGSDEEEETMSSLFSGLTSLEEEE